LPLGWLAYRTFASNNSGSYTLLGRFELVELAASAAERLTRLFKEQGEWDELDEGVERPHPLSPFERFVQEEGLRCEQRLEGEDWPEYSPNIPVAESFGHSILVHSDYTLGMPRALGEYIYVRGGSVATVLGPGLGLIVVCASFWNAEVPWKERPAVAKVVRTYLAADLPEAQLASGGESGILDVWFAGADPIPFARAADAFAKRHALRCSLNIERAATQKDPLRDRRAGAEPV
jgi:hypothetical protein